MEEKILLSRKEWLAELSAAAACPPLAIILLQPHNWQLYRTRLSYLGAETLLEEWLCSLLPLLPPAARLCRYDAAACAILLPADPLSAETLLEQILAAPFAPAAAYLRGEIAGWRLAAALVCSPPADLFRLLPLAEQQLQAALQPPLPAAAVPHLAQILPPLLATQAAYLPQQAALTAAGIRIAAPRLGFSAAQTEELCLAAYVADLPLPRLLGDAYFSPGALSGSRIRAMQAHPQQAAALAAGWGFSAWAVAAVAAHHEQPCGGGYPRGLAGEEIPLAASLLQAAQVYAALRLPRPYQRALAEAEARDILRQGAGMEYRSEVVQALLASPQTKNPLG